MRALIAAKSPRLLNYALINDEESLKDSIGQEQDLERESASHRRVSSSLEGNLTFFGILLYNFTENRVLKLILFMSAKLGYAYGKRVKIKHGNSVYADINGNL